MRCRWAALACLLLTCSTASAEQLVLSLSADRVAIGSTYAGTELMAFGVVERDSQSAARSGSYGLVVTVRGPRESLTVRRKEPLGPIWLNRSQQKFPQIPSFIAVLSTAPLERMMDEALRRRFRLGVDAIVNAPEFTQDRGNADDAFRTALVRLKRKDQLYAEDGGGAAFITDSFFRAPVVLPATAPIGRYEVEASLVADGIVVARQSAGFELLKVGFEEQFTDLARNRPLAVGIGAAAMALLFGWLASVIFRRD